MFYDMLLNPLENTGHDFPIVLTWKPLLQKARVYQNN